MEKDCDDAALTEPGSLLKAGRWQEVKVAVVYCWLEVVHCCEQQWCQGVVPDKVPEGHLQIEAFQDFRWETRRCQSNYRVLSKYGFVRGSVYASMMSTVLLLLNKFESHCPVLGVVVTHLSHQNVFLSLFALSTEPWIWGCSGLL